MTRLLTVSVLACGFVCLTGTVRSQSQSDQAILSSLPVVPMNMWFHLVPQYFVQLIYDDPKYSRIEALIDNDPSRPLYEIILADKTTADRIIYSNSQATVNTLKRVGKAAYQAGYLFTLTHNRVLLVLCVREKITRSYLINTFKPLLDCKLCETE